uniref:Uncharacterized protein n=1 Tax=Plectus sambesii TaxID=2011161 RepID=A0A914XLZ6_9BILA
MTSAISDEHDRRYLMLRHGTKGRPSSFRRRRPTPVCRPSRARVPPPAEETHSIFGPTISAESRHGRRLGGTIARTDRHQRAVDPKNNADQPTDKRVLYEASIVVTGRISNCRCSDCTRRLFAQSGQLPICVAVSDVHSIVCPIEQKSDGSKDTVCLCERDVACCIDLRVPLRNNASD